MLPTTDFVIVDTEGKGELSEIAIVDVIGHVIYEAFVKNHPNNSMIRFNLKPYATILLEFLAVIQTHAIVCHYAEHDVKILRNSFEKLAMPWPKLKFICTFELAKIYFPDLPSYSLDYLSKHFGLKVNNKYFNPSFAHTAKYDALFTHQLYLKILTQTHVR